MLLASGNRYPMALKSVTAALISAAIVIASTNFAIGQGSPPAGSGNDNGAATAPSSGAMAGNPSVASHPPRKPARPNHKKKQSLGNRIKSSFQKKLQKYMAPKKQHSAAPKSASPGKGIPQGQIE
jgi:hypothetical protein